MGCRFKGKIALSGMPLSDMPLRWLKPFCVWQRLTACRFTVQRNAVKPFNMMTLERWKVCRFTCEVNVMPFFGWIDTLTLEEIKTDALPFFFLSINFVYKQNHTCWDFPFVLEAEKFQLFPKRKLLTLYSLFRKSLFVSVAFIFFNVVNWFESEEIFYIQYAGH